MAKKKIDRKKAAIVGILWSLAYFTFILYYVSNDLGFNLLSPSDWESTYIAFMAGQFEIEPGKLLLLLLTLILLVPVWLIGWKAFYSVNWKMPKFLVRHKEVQFKRELIIAPNKGKLQAPVKLRLQSGSPYTGLHKEAFGDLPEVPAAAPDEHRVVSVVEKNTQEEDVQDIISFAANYAVDTFKDVVLEGAKVPVAISTDEKAILITLLDTPGTTWIVDVDDEDSEWYSQTSHIPSPAAFIKKAAATLKTLEPDSEVIPALVITHGEIYDAEDIARHYEGQGIKILRFNNGGPDTLQTLEDFVAENFSLKSADGPAPSPDDFENETAFDTEPEGFTQTNQDENARIDDDLQDNSPTDYENFEDEDANVSLSDETAPSEPAPFQPAEEYDAEEILKKVIKDPEDEAH